MILSIILSLLPSFINVPLRRLMGHKIGKKVSISFGVLIQSKNIIILDHVKISPFVVIRAHEITIGSYSQIRPFTFLSTRVILIGEYVQLSGPTAISSEFLKTSFFSIGDHSRIFPFCWLDTGSGITIGKQVGVGGHTLIFTHGVWSDYLKGAPVTYGPVIIEDEVWLPWRVFILPNVTIGSKCIIAANSLVNRSIADNSLAAGNPAKVIKEDFIQPLSESDLTTRTKQILTEFGEYMTFKFNSTIQQFEGMIKVDSITIAYQAPELLVKGDIYIQVQPVPSEIIIALHARLVNTINHSDLFATIHSRNVVIEEFIPFLRRFGIRLYVNKIPKD